LEQVLQGRGVFDVHVRHSDSLLGGGVVFIGCRALPFGSVIQIVNLCLQ